MLPLWVTSGSEFLLHKQKCLTHSELTFFHQSFHLGVSGAPVCPRQISVHTAAVWGCPIVSADSLGFFPECCVQWASHDAATISFLESSLWLYFHNFNRHHPSRGPNSVALALPALSELPVRSLRKLPDFCMLLTITWTVPKLATSKSQASDDLLKPALMQLESPWLASRTLELALGSHDSFQSLGLWWEEQLFVFFSHWFADSCMVPFYPH